MKIRRLTMKHYLGVLEFIEINYEKYKSHENKYEKKTPYHNKNERKKQWSMIIELKIKIQHLIWLSQQKS